MLTFALLQAFTPYMGIGGGFARSKRTIKNILDYNKTKKEFEVGDDNGVSALSALDENEMFSKEFKILFPHIKHEGDSKLQRSVSKKGFLGKIFGGLVHSTCSHIFLGLEAYGGYQRAENDYFKTGLFLGAQVLAGVNLPHGIQGAIGFGLDASNHVSKSIDAKNEKKISDKRYFKIQTIKADSQENASYWSVAPCLSVMCSKDLTKNVALRLEAQFVLPKENKTPEIQFKLIEEKFGIPKNFKINYSLLQQRFLLSLMAKF